MELFLELERSRYDMPAVDSAAIATEKHLTAQGTSRLESIAMCMAEFVHSGSNI